MKSIEGVNVKGKKVIVRVDYNVPFKDGKILDDNRIVASLKTVNYLVENNAKVILLSHLGRVESEEDMKKNSLEEVSKHLSTLVNTHVYFSNITRGELLEEMVSNFQESEILLVENTRFEDYPAKLESSCDESLSKYWASLGDIFVLDAFGTAHRCHASTYGISKYLPSYAGFLVDEETKVLDEAMSKEKTLLLGGAKVDDKIGLIDNLITKSDFVLIGGAMCFTFLKAKGYDVGSSLVSEDKLEYAKEVIDKYNDKIVLPIDVMTQNGVKDIDKMGKDDIGYDLGPKLSNYLKKNLVKVRWFYGMDLLENMKKKNMKMQLEIS